MEATLILSLGPRKNIEVIDRTYKKMKLDEVMPIKGIKEKREEVAAINAAAQIMEKLEKKKST